MCALMWSLKISRKLVTVSECCDQLRIVVAGGRRGLRRLQPAQPARLRQQLAWQPAERRLGIDDLAFRRRLVFGDHHAHFRHGLGEALAPATRHFGLWRQHDELECVGTRHGRVSSLATCDYGDSVEDRKVNRMPPLLTAGFRPFFLAAAAWAALSMAAWLPLISGELELPSRFDPLSWHMHEMLFGFVMAAVGGFLLTAIPNWTGRAPVAGTPLAVLAGLWLLGRVACPVLRDDPRRAGDRRRTWRSLSHWMSSRRVN